MADNIAEVVQELSGLLRRISERRNEQLKPQADAIGAETLKDIESLVRRDEGGGEGDERFRERLIQTLEHQNRLLESLIARLKEKPGKG